MLCVACGGGIPAGSRFCPRCGRATNNVDTPVDADPDPDRPPAPPPGPPTVPPPPPDGPPLPPVPPPGPPAGGPPVPPPDPPAGGSSTSPWDAPPTGGSSSTSPWEVPPTGSPPPPPPPGYASGGTTSGSGSGATAGGVGSGGTSSGYGPPTGGYGTPPGYAPPPSYDPPPSYGAPPSYAPPPNYGQAPGYPPAPGPGGGAGGPVAYGLASFGQRAGAFIIDGLITWGIFIAAIIVSAIVATVTTPDATFDNPEPGPSGIGALLFVLLFVTAFVADIAYFPYFEGRPDGQTPGKRILGIRVVRQSNGAPLGYGLAIGRTVARLVDGVLFGLGYLWAIWDPQHQTWHDKIAGTLVVRASVYPPPPRPGSGVG